MNLNNQLNYVSPRELNAVADRGAGRQEAFHAMRELLAKAAKGEAPADNVAVDKAKVRWLPSSLSPPRCRSRTPG